MLSHTPPTNSYGDAQQHTKRQRSGSITTQRLRSASDLEVTARTPPGGGAGWDAPPLPHPLPRSAPPASAPSRPVARISRTIPHPPRTNHIRSQARGIIDPHEKGVLRDLIVSGDERLQSALDKFEEGDSAELEALMASGHLNKVIITGKLQQTIIIRPLVHEFLTGRPTHYFAPAEKFHGFAGGPRHELSPGQFYPLRTFARILDRILLSRSFPNSSHLHTHARPPPLLFKNTNSK